MLLVAFLTWASMSLDNLVGTATYYSPGLMKEVASNRQMDLDNYAGGVALNRKGDLGRVVWLVFDNAIEGPFLVVDCAQFNHYQMRERAGHVVEVGASIAMRHGFYGVGPVPVRVYFDDAVTCTATWCAR